jgi:hypothetical protein
VRKEIIYGMRTASNSKSYQLTLGLALLVALITHSSISSTQLCSFAELLTG